VTRQAAQDQISRVEGYLDRAIDLLIGMTLGIADCPALLEEAAECMRAIRNECPLEAEDLQALGPAIRRAQRKNMLAEELLNRATSFYCGWLASGTTSSGGYSPHIENTVSSGRVLIMEA
jgi:hypothetical protein